MIKFVILIDILFALYFHFIINVHRVPVLCFHQIKSEDDGHYLTKSRKFLDEVIDKLQQKGYRFVAPHGTYTDKDKTVILTFDDGTNDHFEYVMGTLQEKEIKAIFFWISDNLSKLSIEQQQLLKEKARYHYIGSHTNGTDHLLNPQFENPEKIKQELQSSRQTLQTFFSQAITLFAYPEGKYNQAIQKQTLQYYPLNFSVDYDYFYPDKPELVHGRYMLMREQTIDDILEYVQEANAMESGFFLTAVILICITNFLALVNLRHRATIKPAR